ncbi:MAG: hypothetical protein V1878_01700 [bacterium]
MRSGLDLGVRAVFSDLGQIVAEALQVVPLEAALRIGEERPRPQGLIRKLVGGSAERRWT